MSLATGLESLSRSTLTAASEEAGEGVLMRYMHLGELTTSSHALSKKARVAPISGLEHYSAAHHVVIEARRG
jgi:hypothetical protein